MTVDSLNKAVYITEIGPNRIWKFVPVNCKSIHRDININHIQSRIFATFTVKPVDITDLLDSHLSHPDPPPLPPTITTQHNNQDHSNNDKTNNIDTTDNKEKKPGPSNPQSPTHPPPPPQKSSPPPASSTTPSESTTFAYGVLPNHPLQGPKPPPGQDHDNNDSHLVSEGSTSSTTEDRGKNSSANVESSSKNGVQPPGDSGKSSTVNIGVFIAIIVMVVVFVLILIGVLKEHKYLRFRGAVCLRRGKVPVHSNGKVNGSMKMKSHPKKTLHSLLGPSQLGFSRLRTYDSDSEEEEFPVFNRV